MPAPTPETLLNMARVRCSGGRNKAGLWIAQQLHANGYSEADADAIMVRFAAEVRCSGSGKPYTNAEARATLKAEYRREPMKPWVSTQRTNQRQIRRLRAAESFSCKRKPSSLPDPESIAKYQEQRKSIKPLGDSPAATYLQARGIPLDLAKASRCKYSDAWGQRDGKNGRQCVVFPICDETGKDVAAQGRLASLDEKWMRTYGPLSFGVFSTPGAFESDVVGITEAPIDALSLAAAGVPSIALCGIRELPDWVAKKLAKPDSKGRSKVVYLAFDHDDAGNIAAQKVKNTLILVRAIRLRPHYKDWNEQLLIGGFESLCNFLDTAALAHTFAAGRQDTVTPSESTNNANSGHCSDMEEPDNPTIQPEYVDDQLVYTCPDCGSPATVTEWPEFIHHYKAYCGCGHTRILHLTEDPDGVQIITVYNPLSA